VSVEQGHVPVEAILAKHTIVRAVYIAPILIVGFGLLRGWEGAWASAVGILIVLANFWLAGAILSVSFRIGLQAYHAAALIGFFLRIALLVGVMYLIAETVDIDRLAFGISAVIAYLVLLVWEAVAVSRGDERELNWAK